MSSSGPADSPPDDSKWAFDRGGGGWGNREWQVYTDSRTNSHLDGYGNLVITAMRVESAFTSARLKTEGKFEFTYGRVEARIRLPHGQGIWPAFWMLGANIASAGWPACGEIDVMEHIGREPSMVHGAMHGPGYSGNTPLTATFKLPEDRRFADGFHIYAVDWTPEKVRFLVDGANYYTVTSASIPPGKAWVFDRPFFLLLNLAVGGNWPGNPDQTTVFPQTMLVDYVRVWQDAAANRPAKASTLKGDVVSVWRTGRRIFDLDVDGADVERACCLSGHGCVLAGSGSLWHRLPAGALDLTDCHGP